MKKENVGIFFAAHDGVFSLYTGVGTLSRDFILSFSTVKKKLDKSFPFLNIELNVVSDRYTKDCFGYSTHVTNTTEGIIRKYKYINFLKINNGGNGKISYGTIQNFEKASKSAANKIAEVSKKYDRIILLSVDTPFALTSKYLYKRISNKKATYIWIPQSTVKIHEVDSAINEGKGKKYISLRYNWEKDAVDFANNNNNVYIATICEYMKNHLQSEYDLSENSSLNYSNGLYFKRMKNNKRSQSSIEKYLKSKSIPVDKNIIFSFGRAEPYKGLDLLIEAFKEFKSDKYFLLLLASPYSQKDPYIIKLKNEINKIKQKAMLITDLDFITPHYLMQWKNTKILAIPSRREPFGIIPIEARYYNNPNITILTSDSGGLKEQVEDGSDGFITSLNSNEIADKFYLIDKLTKKEKKQISKNGYKKVMKKYSQVQINYNLIKQILSKNA